jgi:outer membrane beta-barrel protein
MFTQKKLQLGLVTLALAFSTEAFAQSKKQQQAPAETKVDTSAAAVNPDKVDVTDIEQKYWASKDTDFSVVQNRLFPKANRFAISATAGPIVADPNSAGLYYSLDATYYMSERNGVTLTYAIADLQDNDSVKALVASYGARPDHNKIREFYGVSYNWVPIYAKASVLNTKIVYFDFAISPGIGIQQYVQQQDTGNIKKTAPALTIDFTQQMFFSNHFAIRADYRHRFYQEEILRWRPLGGASRSLRKETAHDQILTFGATFYF